MNEQSQTSKREVRRLVSARLTIRSFGYTRKHGPRRAWRGLVKRWRAARKVRLARFSARLRLVVNARQIERFGLDITGHGAADERRKLRNARKRERHAA